MLLTTNRVVTDIANRYGNFVVMIGMSTSLKCFNTSVIIRGSKVGKTAPLRDLVMPDMATLGSVDIDGVDTVWLTGNALR